MTFHFTKLPHAVFELSLLTYHVQQIALFAFDFINYLK